MTAPQDRPERIPRYFRHVDGFDDRTAFVCIQPDGSATLLFKDGREGATAHTYALDDCLERVQRGIWEEVSKGDVAVPARAHHEEKDLTPDECLQMIGGSDGCGPASLRELVAAFHERGALLSRLQTVGAADGDSRGRPTRMGEQYQSVDRPSDMDDLPIRHAGSTAVAHPAAVPDAGAPQESAGTTTGPDWQFRYQQESRIVDEVWGALGISTYEGANGKHIADIVRELHAEVLGLREQVAPAAHQERTELAPDDVIYLSDLAHDHAAGSESVEHALRTVALCAFERGAPARAAEWQPLEEFIVEWREIASELETEARDYGLSEKHRAYSGGKCRGMRYCADQLEKLLPPGALAGCSPITSSDQLAPNPAASGSTAGSAPSSVANPAEQPIPAPWTPDGSPDRQ